MNLFTHLELDEIGRIIERDVERLVRLWEERALTQQPNADPSRRAEMRDELPEQLRLLGRLFQKSKPEGEEVAATFARRHGEQRWRVGWRLDEVVRDYQILRLVLLEHLMQEMERPLSLDELRGICLALDRFISHAVEEFTEHSQQDLQERRRDLAGQVAERSEELREVTLRLTETEHREHDRLAKTLHDGLQQTLVAARMRSDALKPSLPPDRQQAASEITRLLDEAISFSRDLTHELVPLGIGDASLLKGLEWLAQIFQARHRLHVAIDASSGKLNPQRAAVRFLTFEIVRELLFNVVKHAGTDRALLRLETAEGDRLKVTVQDAGRGFDPSAMEPERESSSSFGLASVRQRLRLLRGDLAIDSSPGKGTQVTVTVPCDGV